MQIGFVMLVAHYIPTIALFSNVDLNQQVNGFEVFFAFRAPVQKLDQFIFVKRGTGMVESEQTNNAP